MKIGIDCDDVLSISVAAFRKFYSKKYKKDLYYFRFEQPHKLGLTVQEFYKIWDEFCNADEHTNMDPIPHSFDVLKRLSEKHKLIVITARSKQLKEPTVKWITKNFPNIFNNIHLINEANKIGTKTKLKVCKELEIDILIDDNLDNLLPCAKEGIKCFWFNQYTSYPPKKLYSKKNIIKVKSWIEIEKEINKGK